MTSLPVRPLLAVLLLSACGRSADARADAFALRDSAGVQIAESSGAAWSEEEGWRVAATPLLQIGEAEGAPEYMLNNVRSVVRLGSGEIVMAVGSTEIRMYDADGRYLRTVGRRGAGPGEFQLLSALHRLPGDTIAAYDLQTRRISLHDPRGTFLRSFTVVTPGESGYPQVVGILSDGSLIARLGRMGDTPPPDGLQRAPEVYLHLDSVGVRLDSITRQPGSERYLRTSESGGQLSMSVVNPLFGRAQIAAVGGGRLLVGSNDSWQIEEYLPDGTLTRVIRRRVEPRRLTRAVADSAIAAVLEDASSEEGRRRMQEAYEAMPSPETMPFYLSAKVDDAGNLWVQEFGPARNAAVDWSVFDPEGRYLGTVTVPDRFRVEHIGDDFVLGVGRDEMDVERVEMYALEKP